MLTSAATAAFAQTPEREPNDNPATASIAPNGGKGTGTIEWGQVEDFDYWAITVAAGDTIHADIDANEFGVHIDPSLSLYDTDGVTWLAGNSAWDGLDPHIMYVAPKAGTYYVHVTAGYQGAPGPKAYTINFFEIKCPVGAGETEPNDAPAAANNIPLDTRVNGNNCPSEHPANVDFFRFDAHAGMTLELQVDTVGRERPPLGCACGITPWLRLFDTDGSTVLGSTHEFDFPKRITYEVTKTGTYYAAVSMWPGGLRYAYSLRVRSMTAKGAGDPALVRAEGLGEAWGLIADPNGDFIVSDNIGSRVWWVTNGGRKEVITSAVPFPSGLGYDAFGNLLIASREAVYKLAPNSQVMQFISEADIQWMAVAHDGTLWLTDFTPKALRHYDPFGTLIETIDVSVVSGAFGPFQVAVAPSGEVYFSTRFFGSDGGNSSSIYKLSGREPVRVLEHAPPIWGFTLDVNGNIYLSSSQDGRIYLYDRNGQPLAEPFAGGFNGPTGIAFGRDKDGAMNQRLFVLERGAGKLFELNPGGVRAKGADIGFATSAQAVADLLKTGGMLSDAERRFLDAIGNKNGRYDVGDLRAFLIHTTTLPATSAPGGKP